MISLLNDKNAIYVIVAFGISTLILLLNGWFSFKKKRQLFQQLKQTSDETAT